MINTVKATNYLGESLTMELRSPEKSGFFIKEIYGLGPVNSTINITENLSIDGGYYNSARTTYRNIVLVLGIFSTDPETVEQLRQSTYRLFPNKKKIEIEVSTDNKTYYTTGYVESNNPNIFSNTETCVISIICPSAYFQDSESTLVPFIEELGNFEFPIEFPDGTGVEFGISTSYTSRNIHYEGDYDTGVIIGITFTGSVTNPKITNNTTGLSMTISSAQVSSITGAGIQNGDYIKIVTIKGMKSVTLTRNGVSYNLLNAIGQDANWFTLARGENVFTYSATANPTKMLVTVEYNNLYLGV